MKPKKKKEKKNSNYRVGFAAAAKRLGEYEYLRKQPAYALLLDMEARSESVGNFIRHVFQLLQKCTGGMSPDLRGFEAGMAGYLSNKKLTGAMDYKYMTTPAMQDEPTNDHAFYLIAAALFGAWVKMHRDIAKEPDERKKDALAIKAFAAGKRFKLLDSRIQNKERFHAGIKDMNEMISLSEDGLLEFGDEIPSPQNLMTRLHYALNNDLKDAANRLVGMLQMVRNKLDPGEYAYFSAMVYMKESDPASLDKAYRELKKIPETAAEYMASRGMLAEVLARKGDPGAFLEVFDYAKHIGQFALWCYVQQLIHNIPSQSFSAADESKLNESVMMKQLKLVTDKLTRCYPGELKVTREEPEYFIFLNNVLEASGEVFRFYQEMGHMEPDGQLTPGSVQKALVLLGITAAPYAEALIRLMADDTPENRQKLVADNFGFPQKWSITVVSGRLDLILRAYRTFLLDDEFVDLFLRNYSYYEKYFDPKLLQQWLTEAYFTALSCEHPRQAELREKLDALCPEQDAAFEDDVTYRSVWGMLTDPGKLLYASAESSYRAARDSDYGWKDAGMLSLGFFRLVEVELRQRLLVDVFGKNDPMVRQWLRDVEKRREEEPDGSRFNLVTVGKEKFELSRTLIAMKEPEKLTMEKMEFCFYLLSEQAETAPEWAVYRDALRQKFYSVLSDEGIRASKDGSIARVICQQKRQDFRNPPAHARYLPIEKAGECRDYVNQTIQTLCSTWLA